MYEVITTVITSADNYDLTDLPTAKSELSLPDSDVSNDAFLSRGISQVSKAAANYCNRVFLPEMVSDLFYMDRNALRNHDATKLQLSRAPIITVQSVIEDVGQTTATALVAGVDFQIDTADGFLLRLDSTGGQLSRWSANTVTVEYTSGYGGLITQATSVPASPGPYTVTVEETDEFALDLGVIAGSTVFVPVSGAPGTGQYSVIDGIYTFNSADHGKSITISYVVSDIPLDLVDAVLRMVTLRFQQKGRDPMLMSKSTPNIGEQRFWVGNIPGQTGVFPPEICGLLDAYSMPTIG